MFRNLQPILLLTLLAVCAAGASETSYVLGDENWVAGFGSQGLKGPVSALAFDSSGNLYVGGNFSLAGSTAASSVARWDGVAWHALGSGITGSVYALACDGSGNLYAGGDFTSAGGVTVANIAVWKVSNSHWFALGPGLNGPVNALVFDKTGNLYAGGVFSATGDSILPVNNIALWNNSTGWAAMGAGMNGPVSALTYDSSGGNIIAGGAFSLADNVTVSNIAAWNIAGQSWSALDAGINGSVNALICDSSGNLYAGGSFSSAGNIAAWNASSGWQNLGSGLNDIVNALALDGAGNLYAGGLFTMAGVLNTNYVAKWNISATFWFALGSGLGGTAPNVCALACDTSNNVYAGGLFDTAGGQPSLNLAEYLAGNPVDHFYIGSAAGGNIPDQTAGTPFSIAIEARDASNNIATSFTGTVDIGATRTLSSGGGTSLNFVNGILASSSVTISQTGLCQITATQTSGSATGSSNTFTVNAGAINSFLVLGTDGNSIAQQTYGYSFEIMIVALDANGNFATGFTGTADISSSGSIQPSPLTTGNFTLGVLDNLTVTIGTVGQNTITATQTGSPTVTGTSDPFSVVPAPLGVTANPLSQVYGTTTAPSLTCTYDHLDLVYGDIAVTFSGNLATAPQNSPVGTYPITQGTLAEASGNYTINPFTSAIFTITPAPLTVTADPQTQVYGSPTPTLTYTYDPAGLVNGDTSASFTGSLATAPQNSGVGQYGITQGTLAAIGNYAIGVFNSGTLTVTPALLTVTADLINTPYYSPIPSLTYTITGFKNGDDASVVNGFPILNTTANMGDALGDYPITIDVSGMSADNYTFVGVDGTLTINPAPLTVTADTPPSILAGSPIPPLTYTYTGLVNTDLSASFTGALATVTDSSVPGTYPIIIGTLAATGNYAIGTFNSANLVIAPVYKPSITSALTYSAVEGAAFSYQITADGTAPFKFGAANLPPGLVLVDDTITGIPTACGAADITLSASNFSGTDAKILVLTIAPPSGTVLPVPTLDSGPQAQVSGQSASFAVGASDTSGDLLSYTWDFGDGSTGNGTPASHTYAPGIYLASVTISNGVNSITETVPVVVNSPGAVLNPSKFTATKKQLAFVFSKHKSDSLSLSGTFPVRSAFLPGDKILTIIFGGLERQFTLTSAGQGKDKNGGAIKLSWPSYAKTHSGYAINPVKFAFTVKKQDLLGCFQRYGISNADVPSKSITVPVAMYLDNAGYLINVKMVYTARHNSRGLAK